MAIINWSENLSVKIKSIDEQHKKLVLLINNLHDAMRAGKGKDVLGPILDELVSYTKTHFTYEEGLLSKAGYMELQGHKREHTALIDKVEELQKKYKAGNTTITIETMTFLKDWLNGHILGTDRRYSDRSQTRWSS